MRHLCKQRKLLAREKHSRLAERVRDGCSVVGKNWQPKVHGFQDWNAEPFVLAHGHEEIRPPVVGN